ncbi:MAG: heme ABC transporter ATP-binding protein [Marinovum algicola]|uniref:Iron complex transport system ATP-binding protein n=1 Tax=Marinovum algicola TaxID=42444 RepID=A0A975WAN5_9RHOB|nr:heme ABC transporter ATP-binding protein [Marinovum algicola]SEJ62081.1 iron complex transport system ATP-binding protein [Marinovum algicola]SLN52215.1 Hemin import ATP-binding protein HmuV [Marinovum algicola]
MLDVQNLRVSLGGKTILDGLTLTARPGQITCIVGPNGSGKTTCLRAITGDLPFAGRIALGGQDIARLSPRELAALRGVLPQASTLAFPFTVAEVVQIGLHRGTSGAQSERIRAALGRVDLGAYADRSYQELSGGEQQRVQLARVLAQVWEPVADGVPRWLFLDEPVSSLDIAHQLQVMRIARDFASAGGGVVAVMHDLNLTAICADKVILLAAGACHAQGTPGDVMTSDILSRAYGCALHVGQIPPPGTPFVLPHLAALAAE